MPGEEGVSDLGVVAVDYALPQDFSESPFADLAPPHSHHALVCDGIDDEVSIDVGAWLSLLPALTVELWFRSDESGVLGPSDEYILYTPSIDHHAAPVSVTISDNPDGKAIGAVFINNADCQHGAGHFATFQPPTGRWHHFAAQYSGETRGLFQMDFFLDGRAVGQLAEPAIAGCFTPRNVILCHGPSNGDFPGPPFVGAIDELRISASARYKEPFVPDNLISDTQTILLLRFESLPLVDDGPHKLTITTRGDPQVTDDVHP